MELWIRSQDRKDLVSTRSLSITKGDYEQIGIFANGINIGMYKTKERALEVLDEIQNILKPTIITTGYECELKENIKDKTRFNLDMTPTKTEIQELSTVVYQMPKE